MILFHQVYHPIMILCNLPSKHPPIKIRTHILPCNLTPYIPLAGKWVSKWNIGLNSNPLLCVFGAPGKVSPHQSTHQSNPKQSPSMVTSSNPKQGYIIIPINLTQSKVTLLYPSI